MSQSQWRKRKKAARRPPPRPWLPIAVIGGGLVVLLGVLLATVSPRAAAKVPVEVSGQPRLKVDRQSVDLGDVALGRTVEVKFQVANVGDRRLWFTANPYVEVREGC